MYNVYNDMDFQVLQTHCWEVMTDSMALKKQMISTMRKDSLRNSYHAEGEWGGSAGEAEEGRRSEEEGQEK